jgi:hypothetical protein
MVVKRKGPRPFPQGERRSEHRTGKTRNALPATGRGNPPSSAGGPGRESPRPGRRVRREDPPRAGGVPVPRNRAGGAGSVPFPGSRGKARAGRRPPAVRSRGSLAPRSRSSSRPPVPPRRITRPSTRGPTRSTWAWGSSTHASGRRTSTSRTCAASGPTPGPAASGCTWR